MGSCTKGKYHPEYCGSINNLIDKTEVSMNTGQSTDNRLLYILILLGLLLAVIIAISIMASVPPVSRDALTHHLAIPKLYLEYGGMYEIPRFWFSYFPMNVTLLYAIPLYFGNDILPKFIHFAFALGTAALIYKYLSRRLNTHYALLGALFFLSIPVVVRLSTTAYVDLGLIFFLFASLLYLFDWIESDFRIRYLLIGAALCGLALGTKYNGLVGLFLLGLFVPFVYLRYKAAERFSSSKAIGYAIVFVGVSLIVFSPWMIRNTIWTGNPVYPLYNSIFNPAPEKAENTGDAGERASGMNHFEIRRDIYGESTLEIALIPVRVFFQGRDDNPKYFDGRLNPFLLLLPILALAGIRRDQSQVKIEKMMMLFFSVLFLLIACAQTSIRIRYFSPIIPPLVILSMYGLFFIRSKCKEISYISGSIKKIGIYGIVFVMLVLNGMYMISLFNDIKPIQYIAGNVARDEYIQYFRPEYAPMQHANAHLAEENKILGVYVGHRGYYSDIDIDFSIKMLPKFAAAAETPGDIAGKLHEKGFSHILINYELFNMYADDYTNHEKRMLASFFEKFAVTEYSADGHGLIRILKDQTEPSEL